MKVPFRIYADESADATGERVFAVAGVAGEEKDWIQVEARWLGRTGGKPFHANVCESEFARDSDPQKHKDNLALYRDLTCILADSSLVGVAVVLDMQARGELFPDVPPTVGYLKCFTDLIEQCARMAARLNEALQSEGPNQLALEFAFASRLESDGTARIAYDMLIQSPEWRASGVLADEVKFLPSGNARLEMSDLLARESSKEMDRLITGSSRAQRRSLGALVETDRFVFVNHDRAYCHQWKAQMPAAMEHYGIHPEELARWLRDTGRVQGGRPADTWANRLGYLKWKDRNDRSRKSSSLGSRPTGTAMDNKNEVEPGIDQLQRLLGTCAA